MTRKLIISILLVCLLLPAACAQSRKDRPMRLWRMRDNTPTYVDTLEGITVTAKRKGKDWKKYYRLVYNFGKVYPYALLAKEILIETDSTFSADELSNRKRNRYVTALQYELFDTFEDVIRTMTISQGKILLRLIDRETGITPYEIISTYKNKAAAVFWQGIAKLFDGDMKIPYDVEGEDKDVEQLVQIYHRGEFNKLYRSIFGNDPPEPVKRARNDFPQL